jgi:hypothetical protein
MSVNELHELYNTNSDEELLELLMRETETYDLYETGNQFEVVIVCGNREFSAVGNTALEAFAKAI